MKNRMAAASRNGKPSLNAGLATRSKPKKTIADEEQPHEKRAPFSLGQTMLNPEPMNEPIINGLLRRGETLNLVASPKVGKSWLVTQLALCVACGRPWLGYSVTQGRVLLADNELHRATLEHRYKLVADAMGVDAEAVGESLEALCLRGDLAAGLSGLELDLEDYDPGHLALLVLDAKYRFDVAGEENSNADQARFYNRVDKLAAKLNCAVCLIHHSSKGLQSGKSVTDIGAGGGSQSRAADCHLVIREHEDPELAVLDAVTRSFPPVQTASIRFDFPLWKITLSAEPVLRQERTAGDNRQAAKDQQACEEIVNVMQEIGEPVSKHKLREETGFGPQRIDRLIAILIRDENSTRIRKAGLVPHPTNKTRVQLYELVEPESQTPKQSACNRLPFETVSNGSTTQDDV